MIHRTESHLEKADNVLRLVNRHAGEKLSSVRRALDVLGRPSPDAVDLRRVATELDGAADAARSSGLPGLSGAIRRARRLITLHLFEAAPKRVPIN